MMAPGARLGLLLLVALAAPLASAWSGSATTAPMPFRARLPAVVLGTWDGATPTPVAVPPPTGGPAACAELDGADAAAQVSIVEGGIGCAPVFVRLLKERPTAYLTAFYTLVASASASGALFGAVYSELVQGTFRFDAAVVDDLHASLPGAIAGCRVGFRCEDWTTFVLRDLLIGRMYRCPEVASLTAAQLLGSLPYGEYECTEATAAALGARADAALVRRVLDVAATHPRGWARRNALRAIGRFADRPAGDSTSVLVKSTLASEVTAAVLRRVQVDRDADVLHDAIWILDAHFLPFWAMQPRLQELAADATYDSSLRFRAAHATLRLVESKSGTLVESDLAFFEAALRSDDRYVRAEGAFAFEVLADRLDAAGRARARAALSAAWSTESVLATRVWIARALDRLEGTSERTTRLRDEFEASHLASRLEGDGLVIRSGLPAAELPAFVALLQSERGAYFSLMGAPFGSPVAGDTNASMTLMLFGTLAAYRDYMDAFVGFGSQAGGLYLEDSAILYTYQRTSAESRFTVEQLVQHEFGHYLQGRYVYPGTFTSPGYHDEAKGWSDEGMGEFLGGLAFDGNGGYRTQVRLDHLVELCQASPRRALAALLGRREGYSEAGVFDYANAWAFVHFLMTSRPAAAHGIYLAFREERYRLADFAGIAGVTSVAALESEWHAAIGGWCAARTPASRPDPAEARPPVLRRPSLPERNLAPAPARVPSPLGEG
jgi:hypothetical protein